MAYEIPWALWASRWLFFTVLAAFTAWGLWILWQDYQRACHRRDQERANYDKFLEFLRHVRWYLSK